MSTKRKSISKKLRFEIFKRDNFQCQYCGKTPPEITLEIDHINPISKNGSNDINNLLTACFECNRGKRNNELDKIPGTLQDNFEVLKEQELQLKEYNKLVNKIKKRKKEECNRINKIYNQCFPDYELEDRFINSSVIKFIRELGLIEVENAMYLACNKINDAEDVIRYFCGICWNKIRQKDPLFKIQKLWENLSKIYRRGIGFSRKGDIERILHLPIETIDELMRKSLSSGRKNSYWDYFVEILEDNGYLD